MLPLNSEDRRRLLQLARQALKSRLAKSESPKPPVDSSEIPPALQACAGVFVSLHRKSGELRGCVGFVEPRLPLFLAVMEAAAAALHDPRFPAVSESELPEMDVEISVLSPPRPVKLNEIRIGTHGLLVTKGAARGLLLPQVAVERKWDTERFLVETCRKAGLAPDAWRKDAQVQAFQAEVFGELTQDRETIQETLL